MIYRRGVITINISKTASNTLITMVTTACLFTFCDKFLFIRPIIPLISDKLIGRFTLWIQSIQILKILRKIRNFPNLTLGNVSNYRLMTYRAIECGGVPNFNQSDARKQYFLASVWLKFDTLPQKTPYSVAADMLTC